MAVILALKVCRAGINKGPCNGADEARASRAQIDALAAGFASTETV
jgi:hypothetical protein